MNYNKLAEELISHMAQVRASKPQRLIDELIHGEAHLLIFLERQTCNHCNPGEISSHMHISTARVATVLNSLEKKNLITRQIDTNNRRQIIVEITEEGIKTAKTYQKELLQMASKTLELLGEDDAKEYVRITKKLARVLKENKDNI